MNKPTKNTELSNTELDILISDRRAELNTLLRNNLRDRRDPEHVMLQPGSISTRFADIQALEAMRAASKDVVHLGTVKVTMKDSDSK